MWACKRSKECFSYQLVFLIPVEPSHVIRSPFLHHESAILMGRPPLNVVKHLQCSIRKEMLMLFPTSFPRCCSVERLSMNPPPPPVGDERPRIQYARRWRLQEHICGSCYLPTYEASLAKLTRARSYNC